MARFYQSKTRVVNLTKDQNQNLKIRQGFADIHSGRVATLEMVLSSASIAPCSTGIVSMSIVNMTVGCVFLC